ncbi:glutaredoxin-C4 [Coniochaeta ligniaria NRRL 30616]|uniref:Glutaredoxin-C4 n=1 Tax=Coniochaeta ligniaria NRRL 30616 TaxID=1408157 RepID=A0A1J7J829_9PEZI|nr:glutaredoxin-C4 [Coniochaeta ligniaria NRRL 30616]
MPSNRRIRLLFSVVLAVVVTILFFTSHLRATTERDTRNLQDFYHKTVNAMDKARGGQAVLDSKTGKEVGRTPKDKDADGNIDADDEVLAKEMAERLKAAEQKAKELANLKAPNRPDAPSEVIGVGSSAGGQVKKAGAEDEGKQDVLVETDEEHEVEIEMERILKRAPVIIFSKSYCPFSKRAKGVLLEKYLIEPPPFVVELDEHPLGPKLQAKLKEMTGRGTVPNIMVSGTSIGGGDDVSAMDSDKTLAAKIKNTAAQKMTVTERFVEGGSL